MINENKDIRWRQRFVHFEKAYKLFERTMAIENLSEIERGGMIQFFEVSFELSWKLLKDYLESEGHIVKSPRETIKQAFQNAIIKDGHIWIEALDHRNITTHVYDEQRSLEIVAKIRSEYFPVIQKLYEFFRKKNGNE